MKRLITLLYAACAVILCANFSSNQSVDGEEKPPINFTGILVLPDGTVYDFENLTLSGLLNGIAVYGIPASPDEKPTLNITRINLDAIEKIAPISTNPHESIKKFDNRDYVEILITIKHAPGAPVVPQHFLVETSRRIFCDVIGAGGGIANFKKEIAFEAIAELTITGFKARSASSTAIAEKTKKCSEDSAAKKALCKQAKDDLEQLGRDPKAKKDPHMLKQIANTKETVKYLCENT